MKLAFWTLPCCALALFLSSCAKKDTTGGPDIYGPFDEHGNYREDWADNPKKWRKSKGTPSPGDSKPDYLPPVASNNDLPPANSVPLVPRNSKPAPVISRTDIPDRPKVTVKKPQPTVVKTTPKPKPKPTVVKAKPKPKPKAVRYVVKKGDSLSAIASRTGASVSAIKSANGISGTLIHPGQSLTIPKK